MQKNKAHCPEATILRNTWKRKVESENLAKFLKRNEILQNKRATKFAKKISFRNFRFKGRTKVSAKIGQSSSSRWMEYVRLLFIYIKARNQTYSVKLPLLQPWQERFYAEIQIMLGTVCSGPRLDACLDLAQCTRRSKVHVAKRPLICSNKY